MKANLFEPFGMVSSGFVWNGAFDERAARPHDGDGRPFEKNKPSPSDVTRYGAAGGLHTTPTDYAKFMLELIEPKQSDAFRLRTSSVEEMIRPHVETNDEFSSSWGLGWQVQRTGVINHGGYNRGFVSHAVWSPKARAGLVVMTNGENGGGVVRSLLLGDTVQRLVAG
jgi:CubicO group peptidase (beta-lactamase class C family)